jgi:hypothetical protein
MNPFMCNTKEKGKDADGRTMTKPSAVARSMPADRIVYGLIK